MTNNKAFEKMKERMELRGFAISTQKTYLMHLRHFTNHFKLPFSEMNYDHVRNALEITSYSQGQNSDDLTGFGR
ncbi:phage integrase N-terminal SAM-like domain-containing protein [Herbivorax sp. ANBcel31]|uniref:phage integrase N-terminal SAM-like domain-containing protein n=1 Tax=Herbivorax sp. ANBcel31 TaxID=3069754 RepID=UPI0027B143FB|nr:phage integrase N-terminal SAM-like domain-containing protein [Herbivorax sp. ANBcel31]MDQ2087938.1 phage integrase N-terminal SAM-like domain-containing protein [Herbivorax sp. ANBcel31]